MSGKFETDDFNPKIWSTLLNNQLLIGQLAPSEGLTDTEGTFRDEKWFEVIVCQKRMLRVPDGKAHEFIPDNLPANSVEPTEYATSKSLMHPVAIVLTHPVHVVYGLPGHFFLDGHRKWIVNDVTFKGISRRCAQAALGAAWKGYGEGGIKWPAITEASFKFSAPFRTLGINDDRSQDITMLRDVTLWIYWDQWERKNVPLKRRTEILNSWGYKCTLKAIKRVSEKIVG